MTTHQYTPDYPDDHTSRMAFIRGIVAAMSGDQAGIQQGQQDSGQQA